MKEIILDTETTGLSVKDGHRIVEIGCIELDNLIPTKNIFHYYCIVTIEITLRSIGRRGITVHYGKTIRQEFQSHFAHFSHESKWED